MVELGADAGRALALFLKKTLTFKVVAKLIFESTEHTEYTEGNPPLRCGLHFVFCFISSVWPRVARTNRAVYSVCSVDFKRVLQLSLFYETGQFDKQRGIAYFIH
ncbi:MAG: hypothetical protein IJJ26_07960 [Victivallales bacterium]|nr:hypothetical protein [Victivallales bacterium]